MSSILFKFSIDIEWFSLFDTISSQKKKIILFLTLPFLLTILFFLVSIIKDWSHVLDNELQIKSFDAVLTLLFCFFFKNRQLSQNCG